MSGIDAMSQMKISLGEPAARIVGWTLLHFVWQGALIAVLTAAALAVLRRSAADVRYVVATIAMSLMLMMPLMTATELSRASETTNVAAPGGGAETAPAPAPAHADALAPAAPRTLTAAAIAKAAAIERVRVESWLPVLVLAWLCGVGMLSLRLMSGWLWVQRMKSHGAIAADAGWQHIAARLSRRLHIGRPVTLLQSALVDVPTVIGWLKPVILLPVSALAGLTPHQLEAILAHELAHIRRHDYLVNLVQTLVETLLFYHPAVWWLSRRIRVERENCCDDLAVSLCGDPYTYAKALADLEELRGASGQLVMAASGGSLVQRVRRLLGAPTHAGRAPGWLAGGAAIIVMFGIAAGAVGTDAFQTAPVPQPPQTAVVAAPSSVAAPTAEVSVQDMSARALITTATVEDLQSTAEVLQDRARSMAAQAHALPALAAALPEIAIGASAGRGQSTGTFSWSNNGEKLEIKYDGEVEFTDDDTDVKRISPGGSLRIKDGGWLGGRTVEFTADGAGAITRRFWNGMREQPFEPEGRAWLARTLPRFIRQSGVGAPARVARILKAKGPAGVLAEIALIEGSWAKKRYFTELLKTASLEPAVARQVLAQAGREIDSDFELASLLIDSADKLMVDEATRQAYFEAARSIDSDFEMRRMYAAALKRGPVSAPVLAGILDVSRNIASDFEQASLLMQIAKLQPLDNTTRPAFFAALATVESDFEHRRVLGTLAGRGDLSPENTAAMLASVSTVSSDFEAAAFLQQIVKDQPIEGTLRAPFFKAVESIDSDFERGRVLKAVVNWPGASPETILAALRAVRAMDSGHEASQVLLAIAAAHTLSGEARDVYIDAAEKLGDFEQGKVLAALVRNERR